MIIQLPEPVSLIAVFCGFFDVTTEVEAGETFRGAVTAYDENENPVQLELQQVSSADQAPLFRGLWYLFPNKNPSGWHLSVPNTTANTFEAYFAEYRVSDLNRSSGQKIKTVEITGSTCLMRVEVYDYPKVEE
jgi:hypothetical protein